MADVEHGAKGYVGRFAPSPTGPLHAGSLVAALASWLDARAHGGRWLVRIEDVDGPRCVKGADREILRQLADLGWHADEAPLWQSTRSAAYQAALDQLLSAGLAYPCACTRQDITRAMAALGQPRQREGELIYPGTCRSGLHGRAARAVRLRTQAADGSDIRIDWTDRRLGPQRQNVTREVGDFVLKRADGLWAYQLAVVVDDAQQHISHIVRGEDLADNTPRQMLLQRCLGLPTPSHLHTPLVLASDGRKLSKQNGAMTADTRDALAALRATGLMLGLGHSAATASEWLTEAVARWPTILANWSRREPGIQPA